MKHILVVDDEKSIRLTISEFLKDVGYNVKTAENAVEALQLLEMHNFDVVVSDIVLPQITGVELLRSIREKSPNVQVVLMTGEPNLDTASEAVRSGAFDYLTKPITKEKITRIVEQALKIKLIDDERRRLEKENKEYQKNLKNLVKERTKSLVESEEKYHSLVENAPDAILIHSEGKIVFVNKEALKLVGVNSEEDLIGEELLKLVHPEYRNTVIERIEKTIKDKIVLKVASVKIIRLNGSVLDAEVKGIPINFENKQGVQLIIRDITERTKTEENLRKKEELYRNVFNNSPLGIFHFDAEGIITDCNDVFVGIIGSSRDALVGLNIPKQLKDKKVIEAINNMLENGKGFYEGNYSSISAQKTTPLIIRFRAIYNINRKIIGGVALVEDITERNKAENLLRKSEERFSRLSELTYEGIIIYEDGIVVDINSAFLKMFGYSYDELLGKNLIKFLIPKEYRPEIEDLIKNDAFAPFETIGIKKDGSNIHIEIESRKVIGKSDIQIIVIAVRDISKRIEHELEIRRLSNAVEQSHSSIVITDIKGNIEYVNKSFTDISGYSKEEVIGENPRILQSGNETTEFYRTIWKILENGGVWSGRFENKKKNGEIFWEKAVISPIKDRDGNILSYLAIKDDITELKKTEDERLYLEKLVKSSVNEIYIFDTETYKFSYLNDSALQNIGYSFEEMKLMTPIDIKPEFTFDKFNKLFKSLVQSEKQYVNFQTIHQRKDKSIYHVEISLQMVKHGELEKIVAIAIDITKRKENEKELEDYKNHLEELVKSRTKLLKESEETFRALAENSDDTIMRFDYECRHLYVNPIVAIQTGISESKFIGKTHKELGFPKELCKLWESAILKVFKTKRKNRIEFKLPSKLWIDWSLLPELSNDGSVTAVLTFGRDITDRKIIEKKIKKSLQKEKELNLLKDQFMSTVSHDLRTPLAAILSSVELMEKFYDKWDKEKVINKYGQIKSSVSRITEMLSHVLELSKIERGNIRIQFTALNLRNELQTIINEIELLKSEKHQLIYNYNLKDDNYKVDINLLREILTNLLTNAIKYSPDGGIVELLVEQEESWLILKVSDEGVGINKNEINNIFNDYYRTIGSQNIPGSGLGLSIVKHYVEMYNGIIEVDSNLGEGSVFKIKIPKEKE